MSTILNDRDVLLQAADPRDLLPDGSHTILLTPDVPFFHAKPSVDPVTGEPVLDIDGDPVYVGAPEKITLTAKPLNLPGTIEWLTEPTVSLVQPAATETLPEARAMYMRELAYADMPYSDDPEAPVEQTVKVTARIVRGERIYDAVQVIRVLKDGERGLTNSLIYAYKRSAAAPTDNPGDITYSFSAGAITLPAGNDLANGWTKAIPTGTDPLYVCVASASSKLSTDQVAASEWAGAVLFTQSGLNTATIYIYQRGASSTPPARPTNPCTYDFAARTLTGLNGGWSTAVPDAAGGPFLFVSTATAASSAPTDTIPASEWAVVQAMAQDGAVGPTGLANGLMYAYQRKSSAPTLKPGAVTYTFASASITTPATDALANGWTKTIPAGTDPLYVCVASASGAGASDAIADNEWSAPVLFSQNGLNAATIYIYLRNSGVTPALPSATTTNTFDTKSLSGLNGGWSTAVPAAGGTHLWVSTASAASAAATDAIPASEWAAVQLLAKDGDAGAPGAPGGTGAPGSDGASSAIAYLYKWSTTAPAAPSGSSTFTWATGANGSYGGADGWTTAVPANPGTPLIKLWVAAKAITNTTGATTTTVSYSGASVAAWAQNGDTGPGGAAGLQAAAPTVYKWSATIPSGPVGSPTYTWLTASFGAAPTGWTLTPGTSPSPGMTLWAAKVNLQDSASNSTTSFSWTAAAIVAVGYAGTNGSNGSDGGAGAEGVSYVTAYCASSTATATSAPANTTGRTSVPATNSGGITGSWSKSVPALSAGQFMYQSDGLYDPATNQVTWSTPYWSTLKVGSLSAISANLGQITGGSIDIGTGTTSWHVDSVGNMWAGASSYAAAPFKVSNAGAINASSGTFGGTLQAAGGTLGTLDIAAGGYIQSSNFDALGGTGFKVDAAGAATLYSGKIGGISIYGGRLQSANFVSGSTGFKINADGSSEWTQITIKGTIVAEWGTIGGINIGTASNVNCLALGQTNYHTGSAGFWLGLHSGVAKFSIGNPAGAHLRWDGSALTVVNAAINNPTLDTFTVSLSPSSINVSKSNGAAAYDSISATPSGGKGTITYKWSLVMNTTQYNVTCALSSASGSSTSVSGSATNNIVDADLVCVATDANGRTATATCSISVTHGTPV